MEGKQGRGGRRDRRSEEQLRERATLKVWVLGNNRHQGLNFNTGSASNCWVTLEKPLHLSVLCLPYEIIKANKKKEVELNDLGSLCHLKVCSVPPASGWGEGGGGARDGRRAEILAGSLPSSLCPALHPALPLNPGSLFGFPQPWKSMQAREESEGWVRSESRGGPDRSLTHR